MCGQICSAASDLEVGHFRNTVWLLLIATLIMGSMSMSQSMSQLIFAGIVLVRLSADFRPFSTDFRPPGISTNLLRYWTYIQGGRPPRKGQYSPKSGQNAQFQPRKCSLRTIPVFVKGVSVQETVDLWSYITPCQVIHGGISPLGVAAWSPGGFLECYR